MSVQPSRLRWPTRQLPTIPAPITTHFAVAGTVAAGAAWLVVSVMTFPLPIRDISFRYHERITQRANVSSHPANDRDAPAPPRRRGPRRPAATAAPPGPH